MCENCAAQVNDSAKRHGWDDEVKARTLGDLTAFEHLDAKAPSARGATEETRRKALEVYGKVRGDKVALLQLIDIGQSKFRRPAYITERYGNKDEQHGAKFGMFPLWEAVVEELIVAGEAEAKTTSELKESGVRLHQAFKKLKTAEKAAGIPRKAPPHDCWDNAVPYQSDGALGHGFECGVCGKFLQAG